MLCMELNNDMIGIITVVTALYALSVVIVLFSGGVPTKWRTWTTVHAVAWLLPIALLAVAAVVAYPWIAILFLIIAATSR